MTAPLPTLPAPPEPAPSRTAAPRRAALSSLFSAGGMLVCLFGSGILSARTLGPTDRGYFALVTLIPTVLCQLGALGISLSLTHFIASRAIGAIEAFSALRGDIARQVLGVAVLTLAVGLFANRHNPWQSQVAAAAIVVFPFTSTARDYSLASIQGCGRSVTANFLRVVPSASWLAAIAVCFIFLRGSLLAAVGGFLVAEVVSSSVLVSAAVRIAHQTGVAASTTSRREMIAFGRRAYLSYLSPLDSFHIDQLVVGAAGAPTQLGWYAAANAFTTIPRVIALNVGLTAAPVVASMRSHGAGRQAAALFVGVTVGTSLLVAAILALSVGTVIPLFYGDSFREAVPVSRVLLCAGVVLATRRIVGDVLRGSGRTFGAGPDFLALMLFVAAAPFVWRTHGLVGVAWAFTIAGGASLVGILLSQTDRLRSLSVGFAALGCAAPMGALVGTGRGAWIILGMLTFPAAWALAKAAVGATPERIGYAAVCVVAALLPCNGLRLGALTYGDAVLVLATPLLVLVAILRGVRIPAWFFVGAGLIALSVLATQAFPPFDKSSVLFQSRNLTTGSAETEPSFDVALRFVFAVVLTPLVLAVAGSLLGQRAILTGFLAGVVASSVVGVLAAWTPIDLQEALTGTAYAVGDFHGAAGRFTGLMVHPTQFGVAAVLALPIALTRMDHGRRDAALYTAIAGVLVSAVLVSGSRAALLSAAVVVAIIASSRAGTRRWILGSGIGAAAVAASFGGPQLSGSLSALQRLLGGAGNSIAARGAAVSDAARSQTISDGIAFFLQRPIAGWGFDAIKGAHDVPLQLLSSGGLLVFAGWMIVVVGSFRVARAHRDPEAIVPVTMLLGLFVAALSMNAILDRWIYVPVGVALSYALVVAKPLKSRLPAGQPVVLQSDENVRVPARTAGAPT